METNKQIIGHTLASLTVFIWGITFISTKILLKDLEPIEILISRFFIGFLLLKLTSPHILKTKDKKHEIYFIFAGLCGVTLYFLCENIALTLEYASNVGVIVAVSPFFTGLLSFLVLKEEKPSKIFFLGFFIAIIGIILISYNGKVNLHMNPLGDLLAFIAPIVWAVYSVLIKKISAFGYNTNQVTARIFFYGLIFMLPFIPLFDCSWNPANFIKPINLFNLLFLGICASAMCYTTWNSAIRILGAVKTSVYIYAIPVVTVITSAIILKENITSLAVIGTCCTLLGLFVSEKNSILKK